ncbi:ATP-dependent Clp protease adaptor ClpS [Bartonella sp. HY038]|uniref:ATP-dependent Clp protease adaptor ClpS n=1 Tax=Bartonella sp. HY038 TaxID=2759660 RepID=UPI0015FA667B|nr:ATP-dependent Clp protease adaptor ClpS [Bartonella sp. HY038]
MRYKRNKSTSLNFTANIIIKILDKTLEETQAITYSVHHLGAAECGVYTYEIAKEQLVQMLQLEYLAQYLSLRHNGK